MKKKAASQKRPKMLRISEEMREFAAMLESELAGWPGTRRKLMFGMTAFYRGEVIFAALPRTRGLNTANSIIFKFAPMPAALLGRAQDDARMEVDKEAPGSGWYAFEVGAAEDLRDALWWLNQAYEAAARRRRGRKTRAKSK